MMPSNQISPFPIVKPCQFAHTLLRFALKIAQRTPPSKSRRSAREVLGHDAHLPSPHAEQSVTDIRSGLRPSYNRYREKRSKTRRRTRLRGRSRVERLVASRTITLCGE